MRMPDVFHRSAGPSESLLQRDPATTAQFFEVFRRENRFMPEKRLMFAVLEDAIICFQKYAPARNHREARLFCEAESWIFESDSDWWFSFENICAHLGIDPNYLRRGLAPSDRARSKAANRRGERAAADKRKYRGAA